MRGILIILALLTGAIAAPALAASYVMESYCAYLGDDDHYNSNGVQLTSAAQIVRQDRANVHRYGIVDDGDDWDSFFDNANNRARMESILSSGHFSKATARRIVNNLVYICVDIIGNGSRITDVQVDVQ